jgi:ATP-binding cassette subfamily B protein
MGRQTSLKKVLPSLSRIFRRFWPHVSKYRRLTTGAMVALVAEVGLRLLEPWPLQFVFDHIIFKHPERQQLTGGWHESFSPTTALTIAAVAVFAVVGVRSIATYVSTIGFALVGSRVISDVRGELYRHIQSLSQSFHTKAQNGNLVLCVIGDVGLLQDVVVTAILPLLGSLLTLGGILAVMFWLNWKLAILSVACVPLFWVSTTRLSRRIGEVSRLQRKREGAMAATATEAISAIKTVQTLSLEDKFASKFNKQNNKSLMEGVQSKRLAAQLERSVDVLLAIATAVVLWFGTVLVLRHELTAGELLVFLSYLKTAFKPVQNFAKYTGRIAKAAAAGERVLDLLERDPEIKDLPGAVTAGPFRGDVHFKGVNFSYETGKAVFEGVDFKIEAGQFVAVVGPSGIGKSTLVSLIARLYDPQAGAVTIDGKDIREYTLASLRSQISTVLQDNLLFATSVRENIAYANCDVTLERIKAAAKLARADAFIESMPEGYDTVLGERGVTLSYGQRQRIAIARAAVRQSPLLILDEPTTGLDEDNRRIVVEALESLARGRTTFLITHDLMLASKADVILYIEDGKVLERGTHEILLKSNGRYASLYRNMEMFAAADSRGDEYALTL